MHPPIIYQMHDTEVLDTFQLLDFSITLIEEKSNENKILLEFLLDHVKLLIEYDFENYYTYATVPQENYLIGQNNHRMNLLEYLNENSLQIFLDDFASIINHEFLPSPNSEEFQYDALKIIAFDWISSNTDITKEFYKDAQEKINNGNKSSIHETFHAKLINDNYDILIYDHGTGEIADFITIKDFATNIIVNFYHIKGSGGNDPGDRVNDLYEVCMQAVKSQAWTSNKETFRTKINNRTKESPEKFIIGDLSKFNDFILSGKRFDFNFTIIQPGVSKATFSPKLSYILAATDDSIINLGYDPLIVIGS
jgi:hypothetical protein